MKILVKTKPASKEEKIIPPQDSLFAYNKDSLYYTVWVKELPEKGKANDAVIKVLSGYFRVPISSISLVRGANSKLKLFDIKTV